MSNPIDNLRELGTAPNNTVFQGIIKNAIVQGVTTSRWNVRTGGESQTVFKGNQAQIIDVANSCQELGYEYTIQGGHIWSITITFPVDIIVNAIDEEPPPLTIWELNYHPVKQNIFEASDRTFIGRLGYQTKINLDFNLKKDKITKSDLFSIIGTDINKPYLSAQVAFNLKKSGVEGRNLFVPTLKRSAIFSNANNPADTPIGIIAPWNSANDSKLWGTEELIQFYSSGYSSLQQIPQFIQDQLPYTLPAPKWTTNTSPPITSEISGYSIDQNGIVTYVGWLQYPAEYQTISLNKVQASQQWQFYRWSAGKYGLYDPRSPSAEPNPEGPLGYKDGVTPG